MSEERTLDYSPGAPPLARRAARRRGVAVTGAASFLGVNLVGVLEEEPGVRAVVAMDTKPPRTAGQKTRFYELDLTEPSAEERIAERRHRVWSSVSFVPATAPCSASFSP